MEQYGHLTDEALFFVCRKDIDAFEYLISRYEKKLGNYIRKRSHASSDDIKDILQNVFLKIYKNMYEFDISLSFSSWAYRIAHNEMVDWYRREKIRTTVSLDDDLVERIIEEGDGVLEKVSGDEQKKYIQKIIAELPEIYQDIILLRYFEDKSYDEIADILMIPPGTVATHLSRGKKKLKELFTYYGRRQ